MAKTKTTTEPILENEHVKELLAILREKNSPSAKDFLSVLNQVGAMEKQLDAAVKELAAMRQELRTAQEQNHPVKAVLQKAVIVMQEQVLDLRERLANLKHNVIDGCKNAVAAFKETGISALDNVARFFKVRPILEAMRDMLTKDIQVDDKAIAKIEAISTEYHQAGRHLKNMGRAMLGREAAQEVKQPGKLAAVISAPFRAERSHFSRIKSHVEKSLNTLTRLEERAAEKKPSIREALATHNEKIAQAQKDAPITEHPRPVNAER
jgi:regulator of replication initiation timing